MSKYLLRLDDACETMSREKWNRVEKLLDKYKIKPLVGVIPFNQDTNLKIDSFDYEFWKKVKDWEKKEWEIGLHGYNHVYISKSGGINPINQRSEFAGVDYIQQFEKIKQGYKIFQKRNIKPKVFFAPSHTFDLNTLKALKEVTEINIISDTIANDIYKENDFYFIPQQTGRVRNLPFKVVTFCYHPNSMLENDFIILENFIRKYKRKFIKFNDLILKDRKLGLFDKILKFLYFSRRK